MANEYYNHGGWPYTGASGASAPARAEFNLVASGFALLPALSGNGGKAVVVNAGGTGLTNTTGTLALEGNFATTGAFNTILAQAASTTVTLPATNSTMARTDSAQTFTGVQTFGSTIVGSINGNAATVTNGVYTTGAGTVYLAPNGSAASLTGFPTLNQNTSGSSASCTGLAATATALTGHSAGYAYADGGTSSACSGNAATSSSCSGNSSTATTATNLSGGTVAATTITATGNITAYYSSDRRMKKNISPIRSALEKIRSIRGVSFDWKKKHAKEMGVKHTVGVIAQEVQKILPEAVATRPDGHLAVRYELLVPLLIEAVKELSAKVEMPEAAK